MSSQALCVKLFLSYLVLSFSIHYSDMASKQQQGFRMSVHPCSRYLTGGDTHILCVACLGDEHAWSALESTAMCFPCRHSDPARGSLARGSGSRSPGLWSRCCQGTAKAAILGFANGSVSGVRDGQSLISAFTWQVQCLISGLGSMSCGFFRPDRGTATSTIWFWGIRCC